jgi:hypothetical protein
MIFRDLVGGGGRVKSSLPEVEGTFCTSDDLRRDFKALLDGEVGDAG